MEDGNNQGKIRGEMMMRWWWWWGKGFSPFFCLIDSELPARRSSTRTEQQDVTTVVLSLTFLNRHCGNKGDIISQERGEEGDLAANFIQGNR